MIDDKIVKIDKIIMDIQRLRNLTTGKLHTTMDDIYQDLEIITGEKGFMTHMLPRVCDSIIPWLKVHVSDQRFWDNEFDVSHIGNIGLPIPTKEVREAMFELFQKMPSPFSADKTL